MSWIANKLHGTRWYLSSRMAGQSAIVAAGSVANLGVAPHTNAGARGASGRLLCALDA